MTDEYIYIYIYILVSVLLELVWTGTQHILNIYIERASNLPSYCNNSNKTN